MPKLMTNGVKLHYEDEGTGKETIVFSHSYLVDSFHFYSQVQSFKTQYRCIAFDHRGHGKSEVTENGYDMENLYQDAVGLIETLDCAPCHFIGLSTGGFIGMRIAIRKPELLKSLILMDTSADDEPDAASKQYKLLFFIIRWLGYWPVVSILMPMFFSKKFLKNKNRRQEVREWKKRLMTNDRKAMIKFGQGIFYRKSVYEQLGKIQTPTLMIVGEDDLATPVEKAERICNGIKGAQLKTIPNAGHLCTVEEPEAVNSAIREFLGKL